MQPDLVITLVIGAGGLRSAQKGENVQFDSMTLLVVGGVTFAAIALYRHFRGGSAAEEDTRSVNQRKDVLRALKSMRKD